MENRIEQLERDITSLRMSISLLTELVLSMHDRIQCEREYDRIMSSSRQLRGEEYPASELSTLEAEGIVTNV